mmetsp:Transcript_19767/g.22756  ORF Transcript_19767/g.22756 Transcript_19767/m.22756 type:complete len:645 (+) Transcript_19767:307-2241(+)
MTSTVGSMRLLRAAAQSSNACCAGRWISSTSLNTKSAIMSTKPSLSAVSATQPTSTAALSLNNNNTLAPIDAMNNTLRDNPHKHVIPARNNNLLEFFSSVTATRPSLHIDDSSTNESAPVEITENQQTSSSFSKFSTNIEDNRLITSLSKQRVTPLSLANMYRYASSNIKSGQRLRNAQFLHRELPIRIAQRIVELRNLPHGLGNTVELKSILDTYTRYIHTFRDYPLPKTNDEEVKFTKMLSTLVLDRACIPESIARGVLSLKDTRREEGLLMDQNKLARLEDSLYRFFTARVGLRFITEHHVLSLDTPSTRELQLEKSSVADEINEEGVYCTKNASQLRTKKQDDILLGEIQPNVDPVLEARRVAEQVHRQCRASFGIAPPIEIVDCSPSCYANEDFTYVPMHLQYMLAELLKNACRSTVLDQRKRQEKYDAAQLGALDAAHSHTEDLQPIRVVIVKGAEDVTIKISDRGGGVKRSKLDDIWTFCHSLLSSTADDEVILSSTTKQPELFDYNDSDAISSGKVRGFGLPLARIYARYFGGELTLKSLEGYGVDAYLYLPMLGTSCENLSEDVQNSPGNLDSESSEEAGGIPQDDLSPQPTFRKEKLGAWNNPIVQKRWMSAAAHANKGNCVNAMLEELQKRAL